MKRFSWILHVLAAFALVTGLPACDDGGKKNNGNNNNDLCGNSVIDTGESCDGDNLNGYECDDMIEGFTGGILRCASDCTFDTSGCTSACTNECEDGSVRCNAAGNGIETCTMGASGCLVWQNTACDAATPRCVMNNGAPTCAVDCTGSCTIGDTRCNADFSGIETCEAGTNGCGEWQNAACPETTPDCTIQGGQAICVNNCQDECTAGDTRCNAAGDGIETCTTAVTGCTVWQNAACPAATPACQVQNGAPVCIFDCGVPACTLGQTRCNGAGNAIETCAADANGCPAWQSSACDAATPFCEIVNGAPACMENCLDDCTAGDTRCNALNRGIETCVTGSDGCAAWQNAPCDPATPVCQDIDGTPTCMTSVGSGESCADAMMIPFPFFLQGDDFTTDFTVEDMSFSDPSCDLPDMGSGPEAVFALSMTAGQQVVFAQGLGMDGQLFIQQTCDAASACLDKVDSGYEDDVEQIIFTAPADGTYYFIVKSYYTTAYYPAYGIAIYAYEPSGELSCGDGFDNDGDSDFDCEDADCAGVDPCGAENTPARCSDRFDNDTDGDVDCADTDCAGIGACGAENTPAACGDSFDNDSDGAIDCADAECTGIGSCPSVVFSESFDTWPLSGWSITDGGTAGATWMSSEGSSRTLAGATGFFAIADSDDAGSGTTFDDSLISPAIDCSAYASVAISFRHYFNSYSDVDVATVLVSNDDGATWSVVQAWPNSTVDGAVEYFDVTAQTAGHSQVRFRFHYVSEWDWYWMVDDFKVLAR